jgi:protein-tyrosine phosphatase
MAAGIMKNHFESAGLEGVIDSAGTEDWNAGSPADPRAIRSAKLHGIDISGHRARQITADDFTRFDVIFAMDRANLRKLMSIAPKQINTQIALLAENEEIADPYHDDESAFLQTFATMQSLCNAYVESLMRA